MTLQPRRQEIHMLLCADPIIRRAATNDATTAQHNGTMRKARGHDGLACWKALVRPVPRPRGADDEKARPEMWCFFFDREGGRAARRTRLV